MATAEHSEHRVLCICVNHKEMKMDLLAQWDKTTSKVGKIYKQKNNLFKFIWPSFQLACPLAANVVSSICRQDLVTSWWKLQWYPCSRAKPAVLSVAPKPPISHALLSFSLLELHASVSILLIFQASFFSNLPHALFSVTRRTSPTCPSQTNFTLQVMD